MMKHLPRTFLFTLVILVASFLGGTKEVSAQIEGISCNFSPTDSVVGVFNDENKIFIIPGAYGNGVINSLFFVDAPSTTLTLFMPDGVTPLAGDVPVPNGAIFRAERTIAVRGVITRDWRLYYRANLVSKNHRLSVYKGQTSPGSISNFIMGVRVKDILDTLMITNLAGQIKVFKDLSLTTEASPTDIVGFNFALQVITADLISHEIYNLSPYSEFYPSFDVIAGCAGGSDKNVKLNFMGMYLFGANFTWFANNDIVSQADTSVEIHMRGGNFNFELKVTDPSGNPVRSAVQNRYVPGSNEWFEMSSGSESCPNVPVNFNYNGNTQMMEWDFGTGIFAQTNSDNSKSFPAGSYIIRLRVDPGSNCPIDTITRPLTVKVGAKPYIFASSTAKQACMGDKLEFSAYGGWSNDYSYSWDVNGEKTVNLNQFNYAFSSLGPKAVILTTSNSCGGVDKDTASVIIGANVPANANFGYNQVGPGCNGKVFQFNPQGAGSYIWDLGFGRSSVLARPVADFTYNQDVKLMVTNGCGNSAVATNIIQYYTTSGSGNISFSFKDIKSNGDSIVIAPGEQVTFSNNSYMPESVQYIWNFGDGVSIQDNKRTVAHIYSDTITIKKYYEVNLGVNKQCSTGVASVKRVIVDPKASLMSSLTVLPTRICAGDKVYFFDDMRGDASYTYSIDYGDGNSVNGISNLELPSIEVLRTHKYAALGTYTYTFTAHAGLNSKTVQGIITVTSDAARLPYYYIENSTYQGPGQYFAVAMGVDSTQYVKFADINESSGEYEFGYHYSATDVTKRYSQGRFIKKSGKLVLIEGNGLCGLDAIYNLTVYGLGDSLQFAVDNDLCSSRLAFLDGKVLHNLASENSASDIAGKYVCPNDSVRFLVVGSQTQAWHLTGNSTVQSTLAEAYYKYTTLGDHLVYATVGNACGRIDTLYTKVIVSSANLPQSYFSMNVASPGAGEAITFSYGDNGGHNNGPVNVKLLWDFGDGVTSTALYPVHAFGQPGTYSVRLEATNGCGTKVFQNDVIVVGGASNVPTAIVMDGNSNESYKVAGKSYRLDGSSSRNATGGIQKLAFTWYPPAGITMTNVASAIPSYVLPSDMNSKKYIFKLMVTDLTMKTSAWTFIEIVGAPILKADAGPDVEAMEGSTVTLDGSASVGNTSSNFWQNVNYTINIVNPNMLVTSVILPAVTKDSIATFVLELYGDQGYYTMDTMRITIKNQYLELFVDPANGNDDFAGTSAVQAFKTIERAVTGISYDGIINLLPGTYSGVGYKNLNLSGKDVYIRSTGGAASTILKGSGTDTLFLYVGGSRFSRIEGLTIKDFGLVAHISSEANLSLLKNAFSNCSTIAQGGSSDGVNTLLVKRNVFNECLNPFYDVSTDSLLISFNSFYYSTNTGGATVSMCFNLYSEITNNILVGYSLGFDVSSSSYSVVRYNDIFNTLTPVYGAQVNDAQLSLAPQLTDPVNLNFALRGTSPCIDAGSPEPVYYDADGSRADMGAIPTLRSAVTQNIPMNRGWNIFSSYVFPVKPGMSDVLGGFITSNQLIKVEDQSGNSLDAISYGYWYNSIGFINYTQGYLAKFDSDVSLSITGAPVVRDLDIPVNGGWSIVGMPLSSPKNVVDVVRNIQMNDNSLKIQSQNGAAFEYLPSFGWVNSIGMFKPGQGYRVRVEGNDVMKFSAPSVTRSSDQVKELRATSSSYFKPIWSGNGVNHMNVYVSIDGRLNLQPGDEVAVYSNGLCLGAASIYDSSVLLPILLSKDDSYTEELDGFKEGDVLSFKVYHHIAGNVTDDYIVTVSGNNDLIAKSGGTLVVSFGPNGTTGTDNVTTFSNTLVMYPNPSDRELTIEFSNAVDGEVTIEVFNLVGKKIAVVAKETLQPGPHSITWDGLTDKGARVASGIYLVRYYVGGSSISKRVVMK